MNKILLVIDMQNDFVYGCLGTKEASDIVAAVTEKIKEFQGSIFYTQDTHEKEYLNTQEGKSLPIEHCMKDTIGWQLIPEIEALADVKENIFLKETFGSKELAMRLAAMNAQKAIDSIEIIGVCTDICVISNALLIKAFLPEVSLSVASKCCAGVTPKSHQTALAAMEACQIEIMM